MIISVRVQGGAVNQVLARMDRRCPPGLMTINLEIGNSREKIGVKFRYFPLPGLNPRASDQKYQQYRRVQLNGLLQKVLLVRLNHLLKNM